MQKKLEDLLIEDQNDTNTKTLLLEDEDNTNIQPLLVEDKDNKQYTDNIQQKSHILMVNEEPKEVSIPNKTIVDMVYSKNLDKIYKDDKIVGQVFNTYWIVEQNQEMFMIDQHSAHERAIYEELSKKFREQDVASQRLIEPIIINATPLEKATIEENMELLLKFGFDIEEFGLSSYAIRQVPFIFKAPVEPKFFTDLLDMLVDKNISSIYDMKIEKIISMSCKKAVKGNDRLSFIEAKALIEQILRLENPFSCPHGRPTIIKMTKYEIEKLFKRIQN